MICNNSVYGNMRTRTFNDIYGDLNAFNTDYEYYASNGLNAQISQINTLFYLLCARYGNSHIMNSDENQFKLKLFSTIYQYGPTWEKRLDIQNKLRNLSENDLLWGAKQINNHSYNPSTEPSTSDTTELPTVDQQTTTQYKKSKMDAYANLMALLEKDVTEEFINKFKNLFMIIVEPQLPLWYVTEEDE